MLVAAGCGSHAPTEGARAFTPCAPGETASTSLPTLGLACIAPGLWVFTALGHPRGAAADAAFIPANGLLVEREGRSVLVDTGWNDEDANALALFAAARGAPIRAALATHFHDDRVGGSAALIARGVPVFATEATIALATREGGPVPDRVLSEDAIPEIRWLFPGPAHSPDNVVVFHADSGTLFGGCMIKEVAAPTLGNVADADVDAWPAAIEAIRAAFPEITRVVPGHGAVGGPELIAHTASLLGMDECGADDDCLVSIEPLEPCSCCGCVAPRALPRTRAARMAETAQMSCQPICDDAVCAPCAPQQAALPLLRASCVHATCTTAPRE